MRSEAPPKRSRIILEYPPSARDRGTNNVRDEALGHDVVDPTRVRQFSPQTFKYFSSPRAGVPLFRPLCVSTDDDAVLADLQPVKGEAAVASELDLARHFR